MFRRKMQSLVSQDKVRYADGKYDLDLTYITRRIIAMGYPSSGVESLYRNAVADVSAMLEAYHPNAVLVLNVCERSSADFPHALAVVALPFPDHYPPPMERLLSAVHAVHSHLVAAVHHVAVVHCLAGRGRTGTVIASYLTLTQEARSAAEALGVFARRRSATRQGVTKPSQRRYVEYFDTAMAKSVVPDPGIARRLRKIVLHGVPTFASRVAADGRELGGCRPVVNVYSAAAHPPKLLFSSQWRMQFNGVVPYFDAGQVPALVFDVDTVVASDFLIRAFHVRNRDGSTRSVEDDGVEMFRATLHAAFVDSAVVALPAAKLEGPHADSSHHHFPRNFSVSLFFDLHPQEPPGVVLPALRETYASLLATAKTVRAHKHSALVSAGILPLVSDLDARIAVPPPPHSLPAFAKPLAPSSASVTHSLRIASNGAALAQAPLGLAPAQHTASSPPSAAAAAPLPVTGKRSWDLNTPFPVIHEALHAEIDLAVRKAAFRPRARVSPSWSRKSSTADLAPPPDELQQPSLLRTMRAERVLSVAKRSGERGSMRKTTSEELLL